MVISQQYIENHQSGKIRWKLSHFGSKRSLKATRLSSVLLNTSQVFVLQGRAMKAPFKGDVLSSSTPWFQEGEVRMDDGAALSLMSVMQRLLKGKTIDQKLVYFPECSPLRGPLCFPNSQRSDTVRSNHPSLLWSPLPHHFSLFLAQKLCSPQSSYTHSPA